MVQGCPPGVDYRNIEGETELIERCVNPEITARFRRVLDRVKGVERTGEASTSVVALLDPSVSNHWGRLTLVAGHLVERCAGRAVATRRRPRPYVSTRPRPTRSW